MLLQPDGTYQFITSDGITFTIYLTDGSAYIPDAPFSNRVRMVGFYRTPPVKSQYDQRVGTTIIYALNLMFELNPDQILVYVCDSSDNRQRGRMKLFMDWFGRTNSAYIHLTHRQTYADSEQYAGLLMNADNQWRDEVTERAKQFLTDKFGDD